MTTIAPTDRRATINISIPLADMQLKQRIAAYLTVLRSVVVVALNPPKAILSKLLEIPLTVLGVGCIDFAVFHVGHGWGWLATGISLVVLEYMISEDE